MAQGVEESGLADVRQSDETACETHDDSFMIYTDYLLFYVNVIIYYKKDRQWNENRK